MRLEHVLGLMVLLSGGALAAGLPAPWSPPQGDTSGTDFVVHSDANDGWYLTLGCSPSKGFSATLVSPQPMSTSRVNEAWAKVGGDSAVPVEPKSGFFPGIVTLGHADALEKRILSEGSLSLKWTAGPIDHVGTFRFAGLRETSAQVMAACPPF